MEPGAAGPCFRVFVLTQLQAARQRIAASVQSALLVDRRPARLASGEVFGTVGISHSRRRGSTSDGRPFWEAERVDVGLPADRRDPVGHRCGTEPGAGDRGRGLKAGKAVPVYRSERP